MTLSDVTGSLGHTSPWYRLLELANADSIREQSASIASASLRPGFKALQITFANMQCCLRLTHGAVCATNTGG